MALKALAAGEGKVMVRAIMRHHSLGVGFIPVFDSLEKFQRAYPGEEPILLVEAPEVEGAMEADGSSDV